jgi:F-type H+-transporting ATPase subunit b
MQINWFTFFAQIVNFLILVLLLRHFLYGPITKAMDEREAKLTALFVSAEEEKQHASQEIVLYRSKRSELDTDRTQILAEAETEAEEQRREMIHEGREEVESMMSRWYDEVEHERDAFLHEARERMGGMVIRTSNRVLEDVVDQPLEAQAVQQFVHQLGQLPPADRHALVESGGAFDQDVIIRSAFDLSYAQRQRLIETLSELIAADTAGNGAHPAPQYAEEIGVRFEVAPELICGVELRVRDRRVSWSVRDYLDKLEEEMEASLMQTTEPA